MLSKMRSILFLTLFLALFSICALAQVPRCNMLPSQFMAVMGQLIFNPMECLGNKDYGMVYSDYTSQMSRVDLNIMENGQNLTITQWINYQAQISWTLDRATNVCTSGPFPYPMGSSKISPNAVYTGSLFFGIQEVDTYYIPGPAPYTDYGLEFVVTTDSCLPFSATVFNNTNGMKGNIFITESFWNLSPSIPPYIFDLPSQCSGTNLIQKRSVANPIHEHFVKFHLFN